MYTQRNYHAEASNAAKQSQMVHMSWMYFSFSGAQGAGDHSDKKGRGLHPSILVMTWLVHCNIHLSPQWWPEWFIAIFILVHSDDLSGAQSVRVKIQELTSLTEHQNVHCSSDSSTVCLSGCARMYYSDWSAKYLQSLEMTCPSWVRE